MREVNLIEKQANDAVDNIIKVQDNIKVLMLVSTCYEYFLFVGSPKTIAFCLKQL